MKKYLSIFLICFLLFGVSVPAFASTDTVVPPNIDASQYDSYIISYDEGDMYVCTLFLASDYDVFYDQANRMACLIPRYETAHVVYRTTVPKSNYDSSTSNNGWGTFQQLNPSYLNNHVTGVKTPCYSATLNMGENEYIVLSSVDVPIASWSTSKGSLEYTGGFFFQLTPPLVLATEEALTLFQTQTFQTIMTIVLCGVGCLALLIGLNLFRKVLPRFLNR